MNRRVVLIAVAAAAAVAGLWYVALWSPAQNDLHAAHGRVAAAQQQAADLGIKVRALTVARKDMPAKQAQLDQLRTAVPEAPQLDQMIATVNDAAIASGVSLANLAPQAPATGPGSGVAPRPAGAPSELTLSMQISGTYFQVMDFMNRMNASPRLVLLDNLNLSGSAGKITTSLTAKMFVQPAPATSTASAAAAAASTTTGGK